MCKVSECCGAANRVICFDAGVDYQDMGICPSCKDHCDWVDESDVFEMMGLPAVKFPELKL